VQWPQRRRRQEELKIYFSVSMERCKQQQQQHSNGVLPSPLLIFSCHKRKCASVRLLGTSPVPQVPYTHAYTSHHTMMIIPSSVHYTLFFSVHKFSSSSLGDSGNGSSWRRRPCSGTLLWAGHGNGSHQSNRGRVVTNRSWRIPREREREKSRTPLPLRIGEWIKLGRWMALLR